ncbi:MAG: hypothetical protein M3376_13440, partial [Actinomycetota bacterium]|nr:hypothetical protein [Actinomycetota bacterium]
RIPAPAGAQPSPTTRRPATTTTTREQLAAEDLQRARDRIRDAFIDARAIAAPGTPSALADAESLIKSTLGSIGPQLDTTLATVGLKLPSSTTSSPASQTPGSSTVTNVLAPAQSLLGELDGVMQRLFASR